MEQIKKIMEQHPLRSQELSPSTLPATERSEISLYSGELTAPVIMDCMARIKKTFPVLPTGFYDIFAERIKANGFCDDRLKDAVACVIDNCVYPTPTIANFISYDRTVKFKTHDEMCKEAVTYEDIWHQWLPVKFPDRPRTVWVHENDIKRYRLTNYLV